MEVATRGPRQRRVCSRGPGLRAMRGGGTWLAWSNLVAGRCRTKGKRNRGCPAIFLVVECKSFRSAVYLCNFYWLLQRATRV